MNTSANQSAAPVPASGLPLLPIGARCSVYQTYTLRVEIKARGSWFADTNWDETEIQDAHARVAELKARARPDCQEVRLIRIRFEILPPPEPTAP